MKFWRKTRDATLDAAIAFLDDVATGQPPPKREALYGVLGTLVCFSMGGWILWFAWSEPKEFLLVTLPFVLILAFLAGRCFEHGSRATRTVHEEGEEKSSSGESPERAPQKSSAP